MISLDHTFDILMGGAYRGDHSWNKYHSDIDNCFKIYLMADGELFLKDETNTSRLKKGDLFLINGYRLTYQYCEASFSTHWLHFIPKSFQLHHSILSLPLVTEIRIPDPSFLKGIDLFISGKISSCQEELLYSLQLQAAIQQSLMHAFETYPLQEIYNKSEVLRMEPAVDYIKDHLHEPIRLEELAALCHISPNYFHKLFTQTLGTTPGNYISLLRMNRAATLLLKQNYTVKEVAYELGFADDAYFSRVFRKLYGIPPGEYKKKRENLLF